MSVRDMCMRVQARQQGSPMRAEPLFGWNTKATYLHVKRWVPRSVSHEYSLNDMNFSRMRFEGRHPGAAGGRGAAHDAGPAGLRAVQGERRTGSCSLLRMLRTHITSSPGRPGLYCWDCGVLCWKSTMRQSSNVCLDQLLSSSAVQRPRYAWHHASGTSAPAQPAARCLAMQQKLGR